MKIQVKLFATLSRFSPGGLPGTPFDVELKEGATLQDLVNQLGIPAEETKVTFVNAIVQTLDYVLKPGDDTGIFPPIGGG
jgi:molybdopterin converting factor small subunit